jgi:hypothetical protein
MEDSDLVDASLDEVVEELCQQRCQPLIEAASRESLVSSTVVASPESGECSALACGEAEHECPDESRNLELTVPLDHAEFLGVSSSIVDGKSIVSRLTIRDEEASSCTDIASSFLSNSCPDNRCCHAVRLLAKDECLEHILSPRGLQR